MKVPAEGSSVPCSRCGTWCRIDFFGGYTCPNCRHGEEPDYEKHLEGRREGRGRPAIFDQ